MPAYSPGGILNAFAWPLAVYRKQRVFIVYRVDYRPFLPMYAGIELGDSVGETTYAVKNDAGTNYGADFNTAPDAANRALKPSL